MTDKITMIELFSGIGAQERAIRQLGVMYDVINTCDCDKDAVLSYAAMRSDFKSELEKYNFPSQDEMIESLQSKNVGYDFQKGKHTITNRTPINKLKQYYLADKLSKNLGDISKVERLPYADLVTYSYPCTDLSVAGKGEGMVNKCDKCNFTWPINFEKPEVNNVCPNCGNIDIKSTRSGLLGQVQRLLTVSYEEGTLPKYLLLENVKNLVGKKFKPQFDAWVSWLDLIGYNTYYKVLNAKHYEMAQNRERIFAISVRKDVDDGTFQFPEQIPLTVRLKDMLEKDVDEKYYLPDDRIEKILNSSFMQEKKRIQMSDVCDTLLARDWKDSKCVPVDGEDISPIRIGNIYDENYGTGFAGNVWDKDGISPTLQTAQGGQRQPLVIDEIKVVGNYMPSNHDASRVVDIDGIAPTVKENHGTVTAIAEPQIVKVGQVSSEGSQSGMVYSTDGIAPTLIAGCHGYAMGNILEEQEPFIVASRGRNPENPSDRTPGAPTEQRLEPNFSGCTNTLTSVQKDNYVCEPQVLRAERTEYGKAIRKQYESGEIDEKIGNMREMKPRTDGISNTITTVLKDNYVAEPELMIEDIIFPVMVRKYPVDCNLLCKCLRDHKNTSNFSNKDIADSLNVPLTKVEHWFRQDDCFAVPDADIWFKLKELLNITTDEFDAAIITFEIKDGVYDKANRCYHIDGIAPTLTAASANEKIIEPQVEEIPSPKKIGNLYPSGGQAGNIYDADCCAPCLPGFGAGGGGKELKVLIKENMEYDLTIKSEINPELVGGIGEKNFGKQYRQGNRVYNSESVAMALNAQPLGNTGGYSYLYAVNENVRWRIRKLTTKECWRLMGFSDSDHDRAANFVSSSALYKQAGNSIVTNCLIAIFNSLFRKDNSSNYTQYLIDFND